MSESESKPAKKARTIRLPRTPAKWVLGVVAVLFLVIGGIWALYWAIGPDSVNARNEFARTVVQILGGGALLASLYFTARSLEINRQTLEVNRRTLQHNFDTQQENQKINREALELNRKTLELNREAQEQNQQANRDRDVTARFTSAVEQLGNDKLEVRLGAIYALERLSKDSDTDYLTIIELLMAYVRERSSWEQPKRPEDESEVRRNSPIGIDIQAVLTVIQRRGERLDEGENFCLDLHGTQLMRADLGWTNLRGANLGHAHLEGADLTGADLRRADLTGANLTGADLRGAKLAGANFIGADLTAAKLTAAYFDREDLEGALGLDSLRVS